MNNSGKAIQSINYFNTQIANSAIAIKRNPFDKFLSMSQ